jgi:hypothetical protein
LANIVQFARTCEGATPLIPTIRPNLIDRNIRSISVANVAGCGAVDPSRQTSDDDITIVSVFIPEEKWTKVEKDGKILLYNKDLNVYASQADG